MILDRFSSFLTLVSTTDLVLANRIYSFQYTRSYETGLSDHHHMIYTMLKTTFINTEPNFSLDIFKDDLTENLINDRNS